MHGERWERTTPSLPLRVLTFVYFVDQEFFDESSTAAADFDAVAGQ